MSTNQAPEVTRPARVSHTTFLRLRPRVRVVGGAGTDHRNRHPHGRGDEAQGAPLAGGRPAPRGHSSRRPGGERNGCEEWVRSSRESAASELKAECAVSSW